MARETGARRRSSRTESARASKCPPARQRPRAELCRRGLKGVEVFGSHVRERSADHRAVARRRGSGAESAARLKSSSIGVPSAAMRMFEGFRSRWRSPREWACSSPSASRAAIQAEALTKLDSRRNRRAGWAGSGLLERVGGTPRSIATTRGFGPRIDRSGGRGRTGGRRPGRRRGIAGRADRGPCEGRSGLARGWVDRSCRAPRPGSGRWPRRTPGWWPVASRTWARFAPPKYGMHIRRSPVAGVVDGPSGSARCGCAGAWPGAGARPPRAG